MSRLAVALWLIRELRDLDELAARIESMPEAVRSDSALVAEIEMTRAALQEQLLELVESP